MAPLPGGPFPFILSASGWSPQEGLYFAPGSTESSEPKTELCHINTCLVLCPVGYKRKHPQELRDYASIFLNPSESSHRHFSKKMRKLLVNTKEGQDLKELSWARRLTRHTLCLRASSSFRNKGGVSSHLSEILTPVY